jgi:hypothetical protein
MSSTLINSGARERDSRYRLGSRHAHMAPAIEHALVSENTVRRDQIFY